MRRVCWSGWVSAALLIGFVALASGCTTTEALIPATVQEQVNSDDRERNYDLAWQEIRALAGDIERADYDQLSDDSLLVVSRMDRLHRGQATDLSERQTAQFVEHIEHTNDGRSRAEREARLGELAPLMAQYFDPGDFDAARDVALEIHVIARSLQP